MKSIRKKNINFSQLTYASNSLSNLLGKNYFFYGELPKDKYSINLQPSIWEKKSLLKHLHDVGLVGRHKIFHVLELGYKPHLILLG